MEDIQEIRTRRIVRLLSRLKWFGVFFGIVMYYGTYESFGDLVGMALACLATMVFYIMFDRQAKTILSQHVSNHLQTVLSPLGQKESVFEIKCTQSGIIIRVYLIRAHEMGPLCTKAILAAISQSWYKSQILATQIVDIPNLDAIEEISEELNEDLIEDLKNRRDRDRNMEK